MADDLGQYTAQNLYCGDYVSFSELFIHTIALHFSTSYPQEPVSATQARETYPQGNRGSARIIDP
jgi:hypothetical protein